MRAPSIIIIASPYEAELLNRALGDTGLRVLRADGGDGALALLATELPIAIIVGTTLLGADPGVVVAEARARHERVTLFLVADVVDPIAEELRPRVTEIFRRPTDFDALAHAIERVAVDVERADLAEVDSLVPQAPAAPLLPRVHTQPFGDAPPETPLVRAHRTEVLSEVDGMVAVISAAPSHSDAADARAATLLRADDALGDLAKLGIDDLTRPPAARGRARAFENRSTIAREIDRELFQAERRLFPDEAATPLPFGHIDDYDDALADIDLESLAIDTIPGLSQSLGIDETRPRAREATSPSAVPAVDLPQPPTQRPVQEEGSLGELDIVELLARLHAAAFSGALHVTRSDGEKVLYLDQGEPVGAHSTLRHDHLGELLFREGKLTREQALRVRGPVTAAPGAPQQITDGAARPVALRLVELGLLKEREIFGVVRRHAEELLFSLFALESGLYHLGPTLPVADDRVRLPAPMWALLQEGVRRKYGLERLSARLGGRQVVLRPTTLFPRVVETLGLTSEERRVVALLDGARTLAEVRAALGGKVAESTIFAVAWTLCVVGAVEVGGEGVVDLRYASTVVTSGDVGERRARPRELGTEQLAAEDSVERERITSKRAQILDADYYAVLGVSREVSEHELRRAHTRLAADFADARFSMEVATEYAEALDEIRTVLAEALRVLMARGVRERYTAHLVASSEESEA